jgi:hypothetical protein
MLLVGTGQTTACVVDSGPARPAFTACRRRESVESRGGGSDQLVVKLKTIP